ncbi:hypothetical protein TrLO_g2052 [Triparma laevis f. longispina]|uniref:PX domain-containing protein n=1 Tax=Triparma laevis f. longispina TaxID=1714387 RepID=A0A9W7FBU6_9STRA|nr:hypothetical protein TrLO_g2052 [Triparma laevis f. longispina]
MKITAQITSTTRSGSHGVYIVTSEVSSFSQSGQIQGFITRKRFGDFLSLHKRFGKSKGMTWNFTRIASSTGVSTMKQRKTNSSKVSNVPSAPPPQYHQQHHKTIQSANPP